MMRVVGRNILVWKPNLDVKLVAMDFILSLQVVVNLGLVFSVQDGHGDFGLYC